AARPRVVLLEWVDPLFSCGHWNPRIVELAGGIEVLGRDGEKSREVAWREVVDARPDVLMLALCGFDVERSMADVPLLERLPGWGDLPCVKAGRVFVTDGSAYFSRPGPRLVDALEMLAHTLHPERVELPAHVVPARAVVGSNGKRSA
ncbi:MAG: cobalamin-binding protein, partial [Phycisphaerae bacterium]